MAGTEHRSQVKSVGHCSIDYIRERQCPLLKLTLFQIVIKVRRHFKCCLFTVAW